MEYRATNIKNRAAVLFAVVGLVLLPVGSLEASKGRTVVATKINPSAMRQVHAPSFAQVRVNGRIAFTSNRDGNLEVYATNLDGSAPVNLTNNAAADFDPAFSPDGARIAFTSNRSGAFEIYVMNADGTGITQLTRNNAGNGQPAWSPDGSRIAFAGNFGGIAQATHVPPGGMPSGPDIYVMNADGSNVQRLTDHPAGDLQPIWSPAGNRIAFTSYRDGNYEVYRMNADGTAQTNLTNNPARDFDPAWSPDGAQIAFSSTREVARCCGIPESSNLFVMNADGGASKNLTADPNFRNEHPAWSPDGTKLAFQRFLINGVRIGDWDIYTMSADGSNVTGLVGGTATDEMQPAWGAFNARGALNGKLAFTSDKEGNSEIYTVNADGTAQTNLTNNPAKDTQPVWSPDGTRIAFVSDRNNRRDDIYVMNADGTGVRRITNLSADENNAVSYCLFSPTWSPDGTKIAFLNGFMCVEIMTLWIVNAADGSRVTTQNNRLERFSLGSGFNLAWSPDGTRFAFDGYSSSTNNVGLDRGIFVMNVDGSGVTRITDKSGFDPAWSPDGTRVVFARAANPDDYRNQNGDIFIASASGGGTAARVTNNAVDDGYPAWSPDGSRIAFARGQIGYGDGASAIYSVNIDGSDEKLIAPCVLDRPGFVCKNRSPDWQRIRVSQPLPSSPGTVQFGAPEYNVREGPRGSYPGELAGSITLTVTRLGDVTGEATVDYSTSDSTASDRSDYIATSGTLRFAPGESQKSFTVLITDDTFSEADEKVDLVLRNATGGNLGGQSFASLTIIDNDAAGTSVNMIDTVEGFVRQQYLDFLNREPDAAGFEFWKTTFTRYLSECGTSDTSQAAECRARAKARVSEAFLVSVEFQETGYLVYRLYRTSFDPQRRERALPRYSEFMRDTQQIGCGVIVNADGWKEKLEANTQVFLREFVRRDEFTARYPFAMTREQFVDALFENAGLTDTRTTEERDAALAAYGNGGVEGRAQALRSVATSKRLFLREFNRAFVLMQYFGYLRRNPNDPQDRDYAGYDFWLAKLNAESGDTTRFATIDELLAPTKRARMVEAFVVTGEYRRRFGPE